MLNEETRVKLHLILLENLLYLANNVSHLWTFENINDFIDYTSRFQSNEQILLITSRILRSLVEKSNIYFFFLFHSSLSKLEQQQQPSSSSSTSLLMRQESNLCRDILKISDKNRESLKRIIESMTYHEHVEIAVNFAIFSARLLIFQHENTKLNENNSSAAQQQQQSSHNGSKKRSGEIFDENELFDQTKLGLYSIIINCDKLLLNNDNNNDHQNEENGKEIKTQQHIEMHLKVNTF